MISPSGVAPPERPVISTPPRLQRPAVVAAQERRLARQPILGLAGLLLVVPIALALALALDGPAPSLVVHGPLVSFALVPAATVAF